MTSDRIILIAITALPFVVVAGVTLKAFGVGG